MMHDIKIRIGAVLPEGMKTAALTAVMRKKRDSFIMAYEKSRESMVRPVGTAQDGRR
jgi:hypothetical protein